MRSTSLLRLFCSLLVGAGGAIACDGSGVEAREAQVASIIASADESFIRTRPALSAGKYTRMALRLFDFYRGTLPLYRNDLRTGTTAAGVSSFALELPLVPSLGDPHPENFGALRASDGSLALEPNDFDAADRGPYLWDVRRLAAGLALATYESNPDDAEARLDATDARSRIVRSAVSSYRAGIEDAARGTPPGRFGETDDGARSTAILRDIFERSKKDASARSELDELTVLDSGASGLPPSPRRTIKRGALDPEDLQSVHADLPPIALATLPAALERYRQTLIAPPPMEWFTLLDAVRVFGSGVASFPRVRVLVLVRGPSDDPADDVLLELKEIGDSGTSGLYPPGVFSDTVMDRIVATSRGAWARPDAEPLWGTTPWLGLPCQVRLESEGQKGIRVARLTGKLGTPEAIEAMGVVIAAIVARVHASGPDGLENARAIYKRLAIDPERFVDEQTDAGLAYAELVRADHLRFLRSLYRSGLRLGIPFDPADAPSPDFAALLGSPPPLPSLPPPP